MPRMITQDAVDHLQLLVLEYGIKAVLDGLAETCEVMADDNVAQRTGWDYVADRITDVAKSPFVARLT